MLPGCPLLALLACTNGISILSSPGGSEGGDSGAARTLDTAIEEIASSEPDPSWLFTLEQVHEVELALSEDAIASLQSDPYTYVCGDFAIDGRSFPNVGIRIKGHLGSYRPLSGKSAFKVNFDTCGEERTLDGLKKLNLNNMVQDGAQVHDRTAYVLYRAVGVPAPRVGYAWVKVDEVDYGLYALVEAYDETFVERWYEDGSGNLYDGDYVLWPDGSYTLLDFEDELLGYFQLDAGEEVGRADLQAVADTLDEHGGQPDFVEAVERVLDLDEYLRFWATEVWVGQYDGYDYNTNNYRVYFDPSDGRADLFPWDHDWAFYSSTPITSPRGRLAELCRSDSDCHQRFLDTLWEVCDTADGLPLREEVEDAASLIEPYMRADPRREVSVETVHSYQADLLLWIETRSAELRATAGL